MDESDRERLAAALAQQMLVQEVDLPIAFRYDAKSGALRLAFGAFPMVSGHVAQMELALSPKATEALILLAEAIRANPGRDIEGSSSEPNLQ